MVVAPHGKQQAMGERQQMITWSGATATQVASGYLSRCALALSITGVGSARPAAGLAGRGDYIAIPIQLSTAFKVECLGTL